MRFQKEPQYVHGLTPKTAIVWVNLGTPQTPTPKAVWKYLNQFLSDARVVEIPKIIWWCILNLIVLPLRASRVAKKYASIWMDGGSPLKVYTEQQANLLQAYLHHNNQPVVVEYAMRYGQPSVASVLKKLKQDQVDRVLIFPAYPQYSGTTTASVFDAVFSHYLSVRNVPELRLVKSYYNDEAYINALAQTVEKDWQVHGRAEVLVMSFHGLPKRVIKAGDPYYDECQTTGLLLAQRLGLTSDQYKITFQSRFGKEAWLTPYTAPTLIDLAKNGVKTVDVICPGFTSDCLETLEEISMEVRADFLGAGGEKFHYIRCVNESPEWIAAMATIAHKHLGGWV